ncbi:MAG TPA: patatin-like phospholipase family protein [Patescibacteria group bacterium]|nr:patatin-like phospholipase family protein [Patescibacteria group bacterium]
MKTVIQDSLLAEIPLFAGLSAEERDSIRQRCSILEYKKDQVIYTEGSPASGFYFVILGRVLTYTTDAQGNRAILEYLHRGKYFGIISLLTGEPHSVTASALNDCLLLIIKKDDFEYLLKKIPALAIDLSQTLSRRIKNKHIHQKTIFESTIISVFSSYSQSGKSIYAMNLALSLQKETRKSLLILDICPRDKIHSLPKRLGIARDYRVFDLCHVPLDTRKVIKDFTMKDWVGIELICFSYRPEDESCAKRLVNVMGLLVNDYHYVIIDLPSSMDRFVFSVLSQSDQIHLLSSPEAVYLKRTHNLIARLKSEFNFPEDKIKVIVNEYRSSRLSHDQQMAILKCGIFATLPRIQVLSSDRIIAEHPDCEYSKVIRRIARESGDCLVGLVLGVGAAYGLCHIGVLKVIEEEDIPIDVICGASMGGLIAALWACGRSSQEILEITSEFRDPRFIWGLIDLAFPFTGFIKGRKLYNFLKKYFGSKTFHDVKLPLKIIASDIRRREPRMFDKGPLIDAIMASCSMPGVFRPYQFNQDLLIDGGVIHPLPTEPLFKMGVKRIIAVNVTPSKEDIVNQYDKLQEQISATYKVIRKDGWFGWRRYFRDKFKNNILDLIFSSVETMQAEVVQREAQLADIVLHPDIKDTHWLEWHRSREFARRGEEEARKNLERIWQLIRE